MSDIKNKALIEDENKYHKKRNLILIICILMILWIFIRSNAFSYEDYKSLYPEGMDIVLIGLLAFQMYTLYSMKIFFKQEKINYILWRITYILEILSVGPIFITIIDNNINYKLDGFNFFGYLPFPLNFVTFFWMLLWGLFFILSFIMNIVLYITSSGKIMNKLKENNKINEKTNKRKDV